MGIVAVLVARMTSSRLPGKPMLPLAGKTNLERHFERVMKVRGIDDIYLATSRAPENHLLAEEARRLGMKVYAGAEEDIVERFVSVGEQAGAEALVRIGCDKPLFCYELLQANITGYRGEDYIYLAAGATSGVTHEILSLPALKEVHRHYHGTAIAQYIREHPHRFNLRVVSIADTYYRPEYRLSLDTPEDYRLLGAIFQALSPQYEVIPTREALKFLDDNPEIALLNKDFTDKNVNLYSLGLEKKPVFTVMMNEEGKYLVLDRLGHPVPYREFRRYVADENRWLEE